MTVAVAGFGIAFDERIGRNRLRTGIAFVGKRSQLDGNFGLRSWHYLIRNSDSLVPVSARSEVRVQGYRGSDQVDDIRRIWIDGGIGNIGVPQAAGEKRNKTVKTGPLADTYPAAGL